MARRCRKENQQEHNNSRGNQSHLSTEKAAPPVFFPLLAALIGASILATCARQLALLSCAVRPRIGAKAVLAVADVLPFEAVAVVEAHLAAPSEVRRPERFVFQEKSKSRGGAWVKFVHQQSKGTPCCRGSSPLWRVLVRRSGTCFVFAFCWACAVAGA